jgi:nitrate/nitrite-specific signal transduction histidine kinase
MQHRLESIGGRCEVISHAGQGTTIAFTVYYQGRRNLAARNGTGVEEAKT